MIKTILVPTSGSDTDHGVFTVALALGRALAAHLDIFHVRLSMGEAALRAPHMQFCMGEALPEALERLRRRDEQLAANASRHFVEFCAAHQIVVRDVPVAAEQISARFLQEKDHAEARLLFHARHSDLIVLGRPRHVDLMPPKLLETLLMGSGRPIVIAPHSPPASVTGTVVVGWKETAQAARSLTAAMPLLCRAQRVVIIGVVEKADGVLEGLEHLAHQLAWHGIAAETRLIVDPSRPAAQLLLRAAGELDAGLLVVGAFGHRPLQELIFGGVTQAMIDQAELPVFIMH